MTSLLPSILLLNLLLPFLDTFIHQNGNVLIFSVYRKPTHAGMFLNFFSNNPISVKKSVLFSLFLRAYRLCDSSTLLQEINFLKKSFLSLGYPDGFIREVLASVRRKFFSPIDSLAEPRERKPVF